ncbi:MAG: hypothetical protein A2X18_07475 [Bacteroidetes bacterium GWF2_40_14]|nr:MAG: hypothetical protein A2X18_07475 [Bacteroidetes bacterium GWF2_40_14]
MERTEFYQFENEAWFRSADGTCSKLQENNREEVKYLLDKIENFYPEAFAALSNHYAGCKHNLSYHQFLIVQRFIKCNFGNIDNIKDIDCNGEFHFEHVSCPLRGEDLLENIVCHPKFSSKISPAEMRVLKLVYEGIPVNQIAESLYLSPFTVTNHIKNAYRRIGIHKEADFIKYANNHNLFK